MTMSSALLENLGYHLYMKIVNAVTCPKPTAIRGLWGFVKNNVKNFYNSP